jgi:hypothetical protein
MIDRLPTEDPVPGQMLVSAARQAFAEIDVAKVSRGAFHTRGEGWLLPQVERFLRRAAPQRIVDPFAGSGDLLWILGARGFGPVCGYDLDPAFGHEVRDGLREVEAVPGGAIVTNPPYLAKHSASRKRVRGLVDGWFAGSPRGDLYQIALDRCLAAAPFVVAILPETFVNSDYDKGRVQSVTVVEEALFADTDQPVCVVCFGPDAVPPGRRWLYRGSERLLTWAALGAQRLRPDRSAAIRFNVLEGRIGLRAVDSQDPAARIRFLPAAELDYDRRGIKHSSRLVTLIAVDGLADERVPEVCTAANRILDAHRAATHDLLLSPFKGNARNGVRRRRLDYATARAILERALASGG